MNSSANDIIDEIDELVNEQLENGPAKVKEERCPHCNRAWHGLKITEAIAAMYSIKMYDEEYSHKDDRTPVVCEGSDFIGPMQKPPVNFITPGITDYAAIYAALCGGFTLGG